MSTDPTIKGLKPIRSITAEEACRDMNPTHAPPGVVQARWSRGMPFGKRECKDLAWYRGHHAGIYDAFLTLKDKYPRVAKQLREAFGLDEEGAMH